MTIDFSQIITAEVKAAAVQAAFVAQVQQAVDDHVEATARSKGYNGAAHCASYANSTVPDWASEAIIFIGWRDLVWLYVLNEFNSGKIPNNVEDVIQALPKITW